MCLYTELKKNQSYDEKQNKTNIGLLYYTLYYAYYITPYKKRFLKEKKYQQIPKNTNKFRTKRTWVNWIDYGKNKIRTSEY